MRWAIILGPLLLSTLLPIWSVWYIGPREATGESGTLWTALEKLPGNVRDAGLSYVMSLYGNDLKRAAFLLLLGFAIERFLVLRGRLASAHRT